VEARIKELGPPVDTRDEFDSLVATTIADTSPPTNTGTSGKRDPDPQTPKELVNHPRRGEFVESMVTELKQLFDVYKTLRIVPEAEVRAAERANPNGGVRLVPSKWVLVSKYKADGSFNRTKGRLVGCENAARYYVPDTWSPTVGLSSVRLLLDIAAAHKAYILTLDVSGAYLKGKRTSRAKVFARLPPNLDLIRESWDDPRLRYHDDEGNRNFMAVDTNWYGLQDAGVLWYRCLCDWLTSETMNFSQSTADPCIFIRRRDDGFIYLAAYVDDTLTVFSSLELKTWFVEAFSHKFDQSPDSGELQAEFLGITIRTNEERTSHALNVPRVFDRLEQRLHDFNMMPSAAQLAAVRAPLPPNGMELIFDPPSTTNPVIQQTECHAPSLVGIGGWVVMAARPAEAFHAALLGRAASRPTRSYVVALKHFCTYMLRHRDDELVLRGGEAAQFETHVDSSWGNCPDTKKSWFGYCLRTSSAAFMWRAKLAPSVALSSRDAEAIAAVFAVRAMIGVQILLYDMGFLTPEPLTLHVDNAATVANSSTDMVHRDSRHMSMRLAFLREHVRRDLVHVAKIDTDANLADIFTKILPGTTHAAIRAVLMGVNASL